MMRQLLWKDYRLNRMALALIAGVMAVIYGLGVMTQLHATWPVMPEAQDWGAMLVTHGTVALYVTILFAALLGGNAIACERADRSAHFLASLPATKAQIVASKLIVAACATAITWAWILLSVFVLAAWLTSAPAQFLGGVTARGAASLCVLTFGVGWLASAILESAIFPVIAGISAPIVVGFAMLLICDMLGIPRSEMSRYAEGACLWTGLIAIVIGTWSFVRRVEP
jgi:ABC-type transport system involved in multi-copper enzyme maturation permease subunit